MKVLVVLISTFILSTITSFFLSGSWHFIFSGNLAMSVMLCFSSIGHFKFTDGMIMMLPGFMPFKRSVVYLTGVLEPVLGIALFFPQCRNITGILLIGMFVLMLSANINAAVHHVNFEKSNYEGSGPLYLWFRVPLQILFIVWIMYFSLSIMM